MAGSRVPDLQEQRFQLLVNAVVDYAIYMIAPDGTIATWNAGARRFKGYEADEIIGRPLRDLLPAGRPRGRPAAADPRHRRARRPLRGRGLAAAQGRLALLGPCRRRCDPRRRRRLVGYAKITRDLTEKRAAEQALRESEQRFRMLVQGVKDYAIYMLDPDGRVTNWNAGAAADQGLCARTRSSASISRASTPRRIGRTASRRGRWRRRGRPANMRRRPGACARTAPASGPAS